MKNFIQYFAESL